MYIFLQKCINSIQEAFINPLELYGALFYDGWMQFIGLLNITHSLLMSLTEKINYSLNRSLWIKAFAKCIHVNVTLIVFISKKKYIYTVYLHGLKLGRGVMEKFKFLDELSL